MCAQTGQGFGFNFGRVLAAIGALQTGTMMGLFTKNIELGPLTILSGHPAACSMISLIYVVGMVLIWFRRRRRNFQRSWKSNPNIDSIVA